MRNPLDSCKLLFSMKFMVHKCTIFSSEQSENEQQDEHDGKDGVLIHTAILTLVLLLLL